MPSKVGNNSFGFMNINLGMTSIVFKKHLTLDLEK